MLPSFYLPNRIQVVLWFTVIATVVGAIYGRINAITNGGLLSSDGAARGALTGAVIASILSSLEVFVLTGPAGARLRQAPFLAHITAKTLFYLVVILFGLTLGARVFPAPGGPDNATEFRDIAFSLIASFIFDINRLLGQNVLLNFVTGRYHHPRLEERVFLLIDMEGSTGFAERLGELAFHRLINRFVVDLTEPIVAARDAGTERAAVEKQGAA